MNAEEAITRWEANAQAYADAAGDQGDHNKQHVLNPVLLQLLGDVAGKRILDAGCGEGYLSRLLAERGAKMVGVDFSRNLVEIARSRSGGRNGVAFHHANVESLAMFEDGCFDLVVCSMVLMDLPDHLAALRELRRVVKETGELIVAINHPCFTSDGYWRRGENGEKLHWGMDNYFYETPRQQVPMPGMKGELIYFHRTLTTYFKSFSEAGLSVEEVVEPYPSEDVIAKIPAFRNDLRMTHFIVFRLKPSLSCSVRTTQR
jgi:ubiquinone/menaquinone biosynthesis C-methylase UbiE